MDDEQYRQARAALEQPRCVYEKAIQYGYFSCRHAHKMALGEREALQCQNEQGHANCQSFYQQTLGKSGFVLGAPRLAVHLTFNKAMKVQIGGLLGVLRLCGEVVPGLDSSGSASAPDIAYYLQQIKPETGGYGALSYAGIIPSIQQFSLRKGKRQKK